MFFGNVKQKIFDYKYFEPYGAPTLPILGLYICILPRCNKVRRSEAALLYISLPAFEKGKWWKLNARSNCSKRNFKCFRNCKNVKKANTNSVKAEVISEENGKRCKNYFDKNETVVFGDEVFGVLKILKHCRKIAEMSKSTWRFFFNSRRFVFISQKRSANVFDGFLYTKTSSVSVSKSLNRQALVSISVF